MSVHLDMCSHTINGIDAQRPNQQNSKSKTRGENVGLALGNPPYCTAICLGGEYEDNKGRRTAVDLATFMNTPFFGTGTNCFGPRSYEECTKLHA